jgi:hypothetical protein
VTTIATAEQLHHVVEAAGLAPSVHNTQPWRFVARAGRLELHADPHRQLKYLDADSRQLHLSCGAALLHARVAARALGLNVKTRLLPDPAYPVHLADLVLIQGEPASDDDVRLATAILVRHTHRGPFDDGDIPEALVDLLCTTAAAEGARLHEVVDPDELIEVAVLLSKADAVEQHDELYREELERWVRGGPSRHDGVSTATLVEDPGSSLRQRDFTLSRPSAVDGSMPRPDHPAVVVLSTEDDEPVSWLRAGQALAAMLLRAADYGVQAQPLGQVTDILAYRLALKGALGIMGMPQLVLRMGYAGKAPVSGRRSVEDVLVSVAD